MFSINRSQETKIYFALASHPLQKMKFMKSSYKKQVSMYFSTFQAYSLFTNMVALVMAGFVVLSTFVPSVQACSMVAVLVHFTMFLFLTSEFLVHLDFYTAIVLPFWHEEKVASNENAATFLCVLSIIGNSKID